VKDEEKEFYEKYIKPNMSWFQRLKSKFKKSKRIKTIKDVDWLNQSFMTKMVCIILILFVLMLIGDIIVDVYHWFFPPPNDPYEPVPYMVPMIFRYYTQTRQEKEK